MLATYDPAAASTSASCPPGAALVEAAWQTAQTTCPVVLARAAEPDVIVHILAGALNVPWHSGRCYSCIKMIRALGGGLWRADG